MGRKSIQIKDIAKPNKPYDILNNYAECTACGVLVNRKKAVKLAMSFYDREDDISFYCYQHKPKYDYVHRDSGGYYNYFLDHPILGKVKCSETGLVNKNQFESLQSAINSLPLEMR